MYRRKLLQYIVIKKLEFRLFCYVLNSNKYGSTDCRHAVLPTENKSDNK